MTIYLSAFRGTSRFESFRSIGEAVKLTVFYLTRASCHLRTSLPSLTPDHSGLIAPRSFLLLTLAFHPAAHTRRTPPAAPHAWSLPRPRAPPPAGAGEGHLESGRMLWRRSASSS